MNKANYKYIILNILLKIDFKIYIIIIYPTLTIEYYNEKNSSSNILTYFYQRNINIRII